MKMILRISSVALTCILASSLLCSLWREEPVCGADNFVDAVGHWADEEIRSAVDYGYINGYTDGRFLPDAAIKRSEFVKVVNAAMGYTAFGNIAFQDVPSYEWYYNEVRKAAAAGYIAGYDDGSLFAPDNPITREEVAAVLFRISPGESSTKVPKGLTDAKDIGGWAVTAVNSAYSKGYLSGYPDGKFYPKRNLTRAETVKVINKVLNIDQASRAITEFDLASYDNVRAVVNAMSRNSGALYWVLLEDPRSAPTALQISQGKDAVGEAAFKKGNVKVKAYEQASVIADGLTGSKPYTMYATVKASDGKLSNVRTLHFNTEDEADMGENWISTFSVGTITETTAVLTVNSAEKGNLYWVIVENSAGRPSQTNIAAGNDRRGDKAAQSGNAPIERKKNLSVEITGLSVGTSYDIYGYVGRSTEEFSKVESRSFTTAGVSTPTIRSLTAIINNNMLEISVSVNAKGTFHWIAVEESGNALPPTAEKIKAGTANENQIVSAKGSVPNVENSFTTATAISMNTKYRVYACLEGPAGALSPVSYTGIAEKTTQSGGLTSLSLSAEGGRVAGGFSFDANARNYPNVVVTNGSSHIIVRPTASAATDIIVDGRVVASGANSERIPLPATPGEPLTVVIETSESGKSKQSYTLTVRENAPVPESVYVSGADPENPPRSDHSYTTSVPANYKV
ncbi:MAG: S-layer homology domain-containing protein, partial [Clostridiales Family XIII bacterium]|nr:S-layer homology domain-containing protein [Clostridiales Family XIII bacterium]